MIACSFVGPSPPLGSSDSDVSMIPSQANDDLPPPLPPIHIRRRGPARRSPAKRDPDASGAPPVRSRALEHSSPDQSRVPSREIDSRACSRQSPPTVPAKLPRAPPSSSTLPRAQSNVTGQGGNQFESLSSLPTSNNLEDHGPKPTTVENYSRASTARESAHSHSGPSFRCKRASSSSTFPINL